MEECEPLAGGDVQLDEVATMRRRLLNVSGAPPDLRFPTSVIPTNFY